MSIQLSGSPDRSPSSLDTPVTSSPRGRTVLAAGRPCPFLGSQDGPGLANNSPSRMNVCHAHPRKEWRGLRRITIPYSRLTKERQAETCFAAFNQCPYHQRASKDGEAHPAPRPAQAAAAPAAHPPKHKKRRSSGRAQGPMSKRTRALLQYAGLGLATALLAFIISAVISAEPGRMFAFVFDYIALQDIKSMGLADKGADPSQTGGVVTGGNLKAMQNLSAAQKDKLKNSSQFKNLSEADKQKLKEKYKAMMGR